MLSRMCWKCSMKCSSFVSGSWTLSCQREVITLLPNKGTLQDIEKLAPRISAYWLDCSRSRKGFCITTHLPISHTPIPFTCISHKTEVCVHVCVLFNGHGGLFEVSNVVRLMYEQTGGYMHRDTWTDSDWSNNRCVLWSLKLRLCSQMSPLVFLSVFSCLKHLCLVLPFIQAKERFLVLLCLNCLSSLIHSLNYIMLMFQMSN